VRLVVSVGGLALIGLLATAWTLTPTAEGFGTHQQLGLPPCTFTQWFGRRCPSCGMTTSWAYLTQGQVLAALSANAGGTLLGLVAMAAGPWLLASGLRGRWVIGTPHDFVTITICIGLALVIVTDWLLRLYVL
jgi:hypothetical protein